MEDSQQGNSKKKNKVVGNYVLWAPEESNELVRLMVNAVKNGWCSSSGGLSKTTVEKKILPHLNEKFGCERSYAHYQSRLKWFRTRFHKFSELMRHNSGFGWNPTTKRFTASNEVWEDYFKTHPTHKNLRTCTIADYEDLTIVFGNTNATRKNYIGLDDETYTRSYDVKEDKLASEHPHLLQYTSSISQETNEATSTKYYKRKRNKTESCDWNNSSIEETNRSIILEKLSISFDSIASNFQGIHNSLMQKREKENNCWDAIKELPNLNSDTRFKAIEWLNTKAKIDMFLAMSPQNRYDWIMFKLSK